MSWEKIEEQLLKDKLLKDCYLGSVSFRPEQYPTFVQKLNTSTINLGRQHGHTTFIQRNAKENDLIIVKYQKQVNDFYHSLPDNIRNSILISTIYDIERKLKGLFHFKIGTIWIDDFNESEKEFVTYKLPFLVKMNLDTRIVRLG